MRILALAVVVMVCFLGNAYAAGDKAVKEESEKPLLSQKIPLSKTEKLSLEVVQVPGGATVTQKVISEGKPSILTKTCTVTCSGGKSKSWTCSDNQSCVGDCSDPRNPKGSCN